MEMMAAHPRLSAFALQTVGVKGLDGFALAVVTKQLQLQTLHATTVPWW